MCNSKNSFLKYSACSSLKSSKAYQVYRSILTNMTNLRCVGYTYYNNVYKHYDVVGPAQHSHRLCRSGARPALTTASLLRSTLNVNNGI